MVEGRRHGWFLRRHRSCLGRIMKGHIWRTDTVWRNRAMSDGDSHGASGTIEATDAPAAHDFEMKELV